MAELPERSGLLGQLATLGWFVQHGEVAATQCVTWLLGEQALKDRLLRHLGDLTSTDLAGIEAFRAENVNEDLGRPDIIGVDQAGRPLLVIEAKFGAVLEAGQPLDYIKDQREKLGDVPGALVLLVPSYRQRDAERVLDEVKNLLRAGPDTGAPTNTGILTWSRLLDVLDEGAPRVPPDDRRRIESDLYQLRDLCDSLNGSDIRPLSFIASGGAGWQEYEPQLRSLVNLVTRELTRPGKVYPIQTTAYAEFEYYSRYVPAGLPDDPDCFCAVGVIDKGASEGKPFWLRFHKDTSSFREVKRRLDASEYQELMAGTDGHLWLPLPVSGTDYGPDVQQELIGGTKRILAVARGAGGPSKTEPA